MDNIIIFPVERTSIQRKMKNNFSAVNFVKDRFQGDADINVVLEMIWPMTTEGKKETRFNPDF